MLSYTVEYSPAQCGVEIPFAVAQNRVSLCKPLELIPISVEPQYDSGMHSGWIGGCIIVSRWDNHGSKPDKNRPYHCPTYGIDGPLSRCQRSEGDKEVDELLSLMVAFLA